jgi:hypothetical protein
VVASLRAGTASGAGADTLEGIERVIGSPHADTLEGSAGNDVLVGGGGDDTLVGHRGRDRLAGGYGRDSLIGNEGSDVLGGDRGTDVLHGGLGTDGCVQGLEHGEKRGCEVDAYASAGGLLLFSPSLHPVGYGYHESLFSSSIDLRPFGRLARSDNARFDTPPPTDGPGYVVMYSRHRAPGPTTATDVVVPSSAPVVSPLDGTVVTVTRYRLYCRTVDWKVVLRPAAEPTFRVLVLHMAQPFVKVGQRVWEMSTVLGRSQQNDMAGAQENQYFPDQYPHVHIEVERDGANPTPGCPL